MNNTIVSLNDEIDELKDDKSSMEEEIKNLNQEVSSLEDEIEEIEIVQKEEAYSTRTNNYFADSDKALSSIEGFLSDRFNVIHKRDEWRLYNVPLSLYSKLPTVYKGRCANIIND